ncbi:hypothetical protein AC1031_008703 [Aphanomyces cochlioides]|nr:hypothetical protein AC1031_008703 [Aphanomyces cochlioides]
MGSEQDVQFDEKLFLEVQEQIRKPRKQAKAIASMARTAELELKEAEDMPNTDYRQISTDDGQLTTKRKPTSREEILMAIAPERNLELTRLQSFSTPPEAVLLANRVLDMAVPPDESLVTQVNRAMVTQLELNAKVQHDVGTIGAQLAQTANEFQNQIATTTFIQQHLEERLSIEFQTHKQHLTEMAARHNDLESQFNAQSAATDKTLAVIVDKQQVTQNMVTAEFERVNATLEEQLEMTHVRMTAIYDNLQLEQQRQSEKIESIMLQQVKQNQALLEMVQQTTKAQEQLTLRSKQLDDKLDKLVAESETHLDNQVTNLSTQIAQSHNDKLFEYVEKIRHDLTAAWADTQNSSNDAQLSFQKSMTDSVAHAQY